MSPQVAENRAKRHDTEEELSRLIEDVREARERLAELIRSIRTGRPGRAREHRWKQWRTDMRRLLRVPTGPTVH
jgi:hypothetical protein